MHCKEIQAGPAGHWNSCAPLGKVLSGGNHMFLPTFAGAVATLWGIAAPQEVLLAVSSICVSGILALAFKKSFYIARQRSGGFIHINPPPK